MLKASPEVFMKRVYSVVAGLLSILTIHAIEYESPNGDWLRVTFYQDNWFMHLEVMPMWGGEAWPWPTTGKKYPSVFVDGTDVYGDPNSSEFGGFTFSGYLPTTQVGYFGVGTHDPGMLWREADGTPFSVSGAQYTVAAPTGDRPTAPYNFDSSVLSVPSGPVAPYTAPEPLLIESAATGGTSAVPEGGSTIVMVAMGLGALVMVKSSRTAPHRRG
jgi:hypothetical protein